MLSRFSITANDFQEILDLFLGLTGRQSGAASVLVVTNVSWKVRSVYLNGSHFAHNIWVGNSLVEYLKNELLIMLIFYCAKYLCVISHIFSVNLWERNTFPECLSYSDKYSLLFEIIFFSLWMNNGNVTSLPYYLHIVGCRQNAISTKWNSEILVHYLNLDHCFNW